MIDNKKIEEAAINKCGFISSEFYSGAKWAIEQLSNFWHHKSEIPNGKILYIDNFNFPYGMEWFRDYHYDEDWDAVIDIEQIRGWIYVKDLLSMMKK